MKEIMNEEECRHQLTLADFRQALAARETFTNIITVEDLMSLYQDAKVYAQIRCIEQILVDRVMSREVVTVAPETSLVAAAEWMLQHRISGMPVVAGNLHLLGVLAEADLLKAVGIPSHHPSLTVWETLENLFLQRSKLQGLRGLVQEHMTTPAITVELGTSLEEAIMVMKKKQIKRLMVVDKDGYLQGVMTRSDIIRVFLIQAQQLGAE